MAVKNFMELRSEDLYFQKKDAEKIKALREKAKAECESKYCEEHKNHCFRCGTASLAEVKRGDVIIDVCVNKNCGAVHLDPGELEALAKADSKALLNVHKAIRNIFK